MLACNVRLEVDGERREGDSRRFISRKHVGILIRDFALCEVMRRTVEKGMNILVKFVFYFKSRFFLFVQNSGPNLLDLRRLWSLGIVDPGVIRTFGHVGCYQLHRHRSHVTSIP